MQSRKTLLFHEKKPWLKRYDNEDFDVPMGCYDVAYVWELVGSYLLNNLSKLMEKNLLVYVEMMDL